MAWPCPRPPTGGRRRGARCTHPDRPRRPPSTATTPSPPSHRASRARSPARRARRRRVPGAAAAEGCSGALETAGFTETAAPRRGRPAGVVVTTDDSRCRDHLPAAALRPARTTRAPRCRRRRSGSNSNRWWRTFRCRRPCSRCVSGTSSRSMAAAGPRRRGLLPPGVGEAPRMAVCTAAEGVPSPWARRLRYGAPRRCCRAGTGTPSRRLA